MVSLAHERRAATKQARRMIVTIWPMAMKRPRSIITSMRSIENVVGEGAVAKDSMGEGIGGEDDTGKGCGGDGGNGARGRPSVPINAMVGLYPPLAPPAPPTRSLPIWVAHAILRPVGINIGDGAARCLLRR